MCKIHLTAKKRISKYLVRKNQQGVISQKNSIQNPYCTPISSVKRVIILKFFLENSVKFI